MNIPQQCEDGQIPLGFDSIHMTGSYKEEDEERGETNQKLFSWTMHPHPARPGVAKSNQPVGHGTNFRFQISVSTSGSLLDVIRVMVRMRDTENGDG